MAPLKKRSYRAGKNFESDRQTLRGGEGGVTGAVVRVDFRGQEDGGEEEPPMIQCVFL